MGPWCGHVRFREGERGMSGVRRGCAHEWDLGADTLVTGCLRSPYVRMGLSYGAREQSGRFARCREGAHGMTGPRGACAHEWDFRTRSGSKVDGSLVAMEIASGRAGERAS